MGETVPCNFCHGHDIIYKIYYLIEDEMNSNPCLQE